jgi:hypothetical protein
MAKDWNKRLSDTIALVKATAPPGFSGDRHVVATALEKWNRTAPADQRKRLSELMSQDGVPNRPAKEADRALRRAAILVQCAVTAPDPAGWAQKRSDVNATKADFATLYGAVLGSAYDSICSGELAAPNRDFLLASPLEFLEKHKITVTGKSASGPVEYGFAMEKGAYKILAGNPFKTATKLRAINVPAVLFNTVERSLDSITGTRSSDHDDCSLMLTTQFTGCTYCFMVSADGTSLVAAHIDPGGGVGRTSPHSGESISQTLRVNGGFKNGNGGVFRAYGRVADAGVFGYPKSATQMIITALTHSGRWHVYAQIAEGNGFRVERIDNLPG